MTYNELATLFNSEFGAHAPWPKIYNVDSETYGNVLDAIIKSKPVWDEDKTSLYFTRNFETKNIVFVTIIIGPNKGIMFKNVELILV